MKKPIFAILLLFIGSGCLFAQKNSAFEKLCISEEEFAVYKIVGVTNFQNPTDIYSSRDFDFLKSKFPGISPETAADYQGKE